MKKVRQFLVLLLILILCVSLVAGCAQSSKNTQENQTKVKNPDTMVVAYNDQPTTLDPHIAYDPESLQAISQVYEGLVTYKGGTNEVVPQLAERWETSSDGKVWTFYLKKNIKFTRG